jgi:hypothetical protein
VSGCGHTLCVPRIVPFFTHSSVFTLLTVPTGEVLSRHCVWLKPRD